MLNISKKQLSALLIFFVALTTLSYYHRYASGDDAWFAEQSYWLHKEGVIRSEFFRGLLGWEKQLLVSHKLFLIFGAGMIHLFGYELPVLQYVSIIFFAILVGEIIFYIRREEKTINSWYLPAILILVFSNRILVKMSFENRPEIMLAALGFGSFLFISKNKPHHLQSLAAGMLAGMAVLTHLNGVIYFIAGAGMLFYLKQYKNALTFSIAGGLISLLYFVDIIQAADGFKTWHYQFIHDPATQNAMGLASKLMVMVTYPVLFFHSPEQVALSLLLTFLLWNQRLFLKQLPVPLRIYSIILLLVFWLITKKNSGVYLTLFLPFMLVLTYELYKIKPFKTIALKVILGVYFIIGIYGTIQIIYKNLTLEYLPVSYQRLQKDIPDHQRGFVPLTFFFNEMDNYPHLLSHENFKIQSIMAKSEASPYNMARWAQANKAEFILMDYEFRPEKFYPKPGTKILPPYHLTFFDGRFAIYEN
ncbi:hypothetical protein [Dyadobacter sp. CY356]|uniref:hypothetical protein n=1 Tax=Dyadobacter sp. CY356 TaxID=2906442 RepID=UPI001F2061EE|nr:hypothetical protein [Dyadobacter sp. CY356]MCF0055820.1 hypothetical protein [Dyadobacter sp. CY356]